MDNANLKNTLRGWGLLAPMILILGVVTIFPLYRTILFSFTDAKIDQLDNFKFIGFKNYFFRIEDFNLGVLADPQWWVSVKNTLVFTGISVSIETVLGLIVALCLHRAFKGRGIFRAIVLIPWAIPTVVSAKIWSWMLNDQLGIINDLLIRLSIIDSPIAWTSNASTVMGTLIFVDVWKTTPFMALLILAGLQIIPTHIFQAAKVDGISGIKLFFSVILPLLRPTIIVTVVFRALDALRIFDLIYVLTPSNPNTISMSVYVRENLFDFDNFSYGSAASVLLFLIVCMLTISYLGLNTYLNKRENK